MIPLAFPISCLKADQNIYWLPYYQAKLQILLH
jgi:hypothetical protein